VQPFSNAHGGFHDGLESTLHYVNARLYMHALCSISWVMSILQLHDISSMSLDVSTSSWLKPSRAATFTNFQQRSNRASQTDFVAAHGHPTEIALFERLRIIATDILTRQFFQEEKDTRLSVVACCFAGKL
jgi:hypothetical protein